MLDNDEDTSSPTLLNSDADNDGIDDVLDIDANAGSDANNNGINDALEPTDSDGDGVPNHLDLDSDNDSLLDLPEQGLSDTDGNGFIDTGSTETQNPPDTDADGAPDYIDVDSNNDGTNDIDTNNNGGADNDNDGMADDTTDTDNDGIPDSIDPTPTSPGGSGTTPPNVPPTNAPPGGGSGGALETAVSGSSTGFISLLLLGLTIISRKLPLGSTTAPAWSPAIALNHQDLLMKERINRRRASSFQTLGTVGVLPVGDVTKCRRRR